MPEQLLNNLDVSAARAQERCTGVAKRVPPDFLRDAHPARNLADLIAHERLSPVRLSLVAVGTGEDPVASGFVLRVIPPRAESSRENRVERNWFLRRLRFAGADDLKNDGARNADLVFIEVDVYPLESEQLACPQSCNDIEQDHGSLAEIEGAQQQLDFFDFEYGWDLLSLGALAHPLHRVPIEEFMTQAVIEKDTYHVTNLGAGRTS